MFRRMRQVAFNMKYRRLRERCEMLARYQAERIVGLTLVCHEDAWNLVKDLPMFGQVDSDRVEKREDGLLGVTLSPVQLEALMSRVSVEKVVRKALGPDDRGLSPAQFSCLYLMSERIVDALVDSTDWKRPFIKKPAPSVVYVHRPDGEGIETPSDSPVDVL